MEQSFLLVVVTLTSAGACWLGARTLGHSVAALGAALGRMFECAGVVLVFFAANLAVGSLAVLAVRALMRDFVSLYLAADLTLLLVALLQGLVFQSWRETGRATRDPRASEV
ncbi:MAG: hypothetical protein HY727_07085 [Candidatus Rokubacteria bacterium]|nr:hypothetical protein [Candidatus Rokubacteria bacterium]